jgi:hypothetical protein
VPDTSGGDLAAARAWAGAYTAMSGQLDKANGRTSDTISIVRECEKQVNAARAG